MSLILSSGLFPLVVYNHAMSCEFKNSSMDGRVPACKKIVALKEIIQRDDLGEVFTPIELMEEICNNSNIRAREQCPAYENMRLHGRGSLYCK